MPPKAPESFEKAVFSDPRKRDIRGRWALFVFLLACLGIVYWIVRDIVYQRWVYAYAQRMFNDLASASVEKIEDVDLEREGNIVLTRAEAYTHHGLTLGSGIYGSTFFMLTGFHGMHVTLGAIMLTVIWFRCAKGHFTKDNHFGFEAVAWYWHFVDVVWLGLFLFVYVL